MSKASIWCHARTITARSVEDETRNAHRNAKRNPNRNQETTLSWLFSNFQTKRDLESKLHESGEDFVVIGTQRTHIVIFVVISVSSDIWVFVMVFICLKTRKDFVSRSSRSDDHFESHLPINGLHTSQKTYFRVFRHLFHVEDAIVIFVVISVSLDIWVFVIVFICLKTRK